MCLLKREQNDTGCGHPDCKNYYMLNKQFCLHNPNTSQHPNNMFNLPNLLLQAQNPPKPFSTPMNPYNLNMQQSLNTKRLAVPSDKDHDEPEAMTLNKKKMKLKEENANHDGQQTQNSSSNNTPFNVNEHGVAGVQAANQMIDNRGLLNNQLLNNMMLNNNQANILMQDPSHFNDMFSSMLQNPQGANLANPVHFGHMMAQNPRFNPGFQMSGFPENINITDLENKVKTEHMTTAENNNFKDFQAQIYGLLFSQNKMLVDLKEKNETVQDTLACLIGEINVLKSAVSQNIQPKPVVNVSNPLIAHQILGNSSETGSVETLINYLYGPKPDFQYQLVLKNDIELPLYRERNFKFTIMLVDKNGKPVTNSNRIPLTIGIYSSENPPKYIDVNTAGNKILKGFIEKDLINGSATFEKIQVKEVTSHFRNGWIFFVVYPKLTKNINNNVLATGNGVNVNIQNIRPLILEKVVVKAKKTKEKDQTVGGDGTPSSQNDDVKQSNT